MKKWIQLSFDFKPWDDEEIWKDIRKGYQASNKGRTRSLDRYVERNGRLMFVKGRILKQCLNRDGYPIVTLHDNGKRKYKYVHQLVWEAFNGKIPEGMEINHISECKTDNSLSNLNLLSHRANVNWGTRNERTGKALSKSVAQKSLDGEVIKIWPSTMEIQRELGYSHRNICSCCNGKRKTAYGYIWQYEEKVAS